LVNITISILILIRKAAACGQYLRMHKSGGSLIAFNSEVIVYPLATNVEDANLYSFGNTYPISWITLLLGAMKFSWLPE
jgi:hypothetical protein